MKYLIIPTNVFSLSGKKGAVFSDLPDVVRHFLAAFKEKVFIVCDEISTIKVSSPMKEKDKSIRCQTIKLLEQHSESRCGLTGTLLTKSPLNVIDTAQFLSSALFSSASMWQYAERYCVMMSLRVGRGRRVMISPKEWEKARKRMINAYNFGVKMKINPEAQLQGAKERIFSEVGISYENLEHILNHKKYTPFRNVEQMMKELTPYMMTVERKDIFDISFDEKVYHPIVRSVEISAEAKKIGNQLVKVGFSDNLTLGKAPSLELAGRLQDLCNGFEPLKDEETEKVTYRPLKENPKLDALMELLEEIDLEKEQVAVWCWRVNAYESIEERCRKEGIPYVTYTGSGTDKEKKEAERKAASGEARVFIANQASAGFGLNCLSAFNYCVWYCQGDSYEIYHQAQHRILRGQSKTPKFAYVLSVKNSVEERSMERLIAGEELLGAANKKDVFLFS